MYGLGAPNLKIGPTTTQKDLVAAVDAGAIVGTCRALDRIRRAPVSLYVGANGHGDQVFSLGQLPREQREKRLYLHRFTKASASGALFRAYVQAAPEAP